MLKQLTDQYYRLSTEAEELLQHAITQLREERVPTEEETQKINTALTGLQTAYSEIREYACQKVGRDEMPEEGAPIRAYAAIVHHKRMITEGILKEFLQAYTDTERFKEALQQAQKKAQQTLDVFQKDLSFEPDVIPYKAFVDGVKMDKSRLDSQEGDELLDVVGTLDARLAKGIQWGHFYLRQEEIKGLEAEDPNAPMDEEEEFTDEDLDELRPELEAEEETSSNESGEEKSEDEAEDVDDDASDFSEEEWVCARKFKVYNTLPSIQKLAEAFHNEAAPLLLCLMGEVHVFAAELFKSVVRNEKWNVSPCLEALENKGYLVAYEMEGKVYYCPSQIFAVCIDRPKRAKILQDIRNRKIRPQDSLRKKRIPAPLLIGTEKIEKNTLLKYISRMQALSVIYKMDVDYKWDTDSEAYVFSGEKGIKDVTLVAPDQYSSRIMKKEDSVCSYGDALPEPNAMQNAAAKNCFFFTDALYRWDSAEWKVFEAESSCGEEEDVESVNVPEVTSESDADENGAEEPAEEREEIQNAGAAAENDEDVNARNMDQPGQMPTAETIEMQPKPAEIKEAQAEDVPEERQSEDNAYNEQPKEDGKIALLARIRSADSAQMRERYMKSVYEAYAEGRRGIGTALMMALKQIHPDVEDEWLKWTCASENAVYVGDRNATRLQEIYHDVDSSGLADSALAVSAYLRMFFSDDAAKEYWVQFADAIAETQVPKQVSSLRDLLQRLQKYVDENQCGINEETMLAMHEKIDIEDRFVQLKNEADNFIKARLAETTIGNTRVKDLFEVLFGKGSLMMDALGCICENRKEEAGRICKLLEQIDPGLLNNKPAAVEQWIECTWNNSTKKLKGKNANDNIKGSARNSAINRTKTVLTVIDQWIDLCLHDDGLLMKKIIAAAGEVKYLAKIIADAIEEVKAYKSELRSDLAGYAALLLLEDTLQYFGNLMNGEGTMNPGADRNAEVAACNEMAVDEDGTVYIIPAEDMVMPYEQCIILEKLLKESPVSAEDSAVRFIGNIDSEAGNFGNGRYLIKCAQRTSKKSELADFSKSEYAVGVKAAMEMVEKEEREFHARMEMAQGYGWFDSYEEQHRIECAAAKQCETYKSWDDFAACVACMKRTFAWCRKEAQDKNRDQLKADLDDIIRCYEVDEENVTIARIKKLIEQDCFAAATVEIRRIYKDKRVEDPFRIVNEGKFDFFIQNFQSFYTAVYNVNIKMEKIFNDRNSHNRKGYVGNGREMLRAWPQSPEGLTCSNVRTILERLNLDIDNIFSHGKGAEGHVTVKFKPRTSMEFVHPIADFGTKMIEGGLDVFYMGGNKTAGQYFDLIRANIGKGTGHSAIFMVNSAMTLSVRRQLTSKIWHELRSARPLIILDRVLALYVAEHEKIDRWNVLLRCALPFAMVKPYTENSSAQQPPEMFVGRVLELRKLMSFGQDGANLVYGGRQLGKSAILYRVEQELHNEKNSVYVVFCAIKDLNAEEAVRYILLEMVKKKVPGAENIPQNAVWQDMCFEINVILTKHPEMKLMLLIDEADTLLSKDRETGYQALSAIKKVQDTSDNRFKFVLAGLHNVMRFHNEALKNNSDLPKLGSVNIKPLDYGNAEMLLKKPLSYLGFMFNEKEEQQALISMILSTTNYYPGLIHYYCASLLNTFGDGHTEPAPTKPPYELDEKLIFKLLQKKEFMEQTKQKFMMTIGIDEKEHQYYSILAYLMAYCYDEYDSQIEGVSVEDICAAAEELDISVISQLQTSQVETLLDELCELNILYNEHNSQQKRYVFSRTAFKDMLGTQDDVLEALIKYSCIEEVSK